MSKMNVSYIYDFKIILIGDERVGKTALLHYFLTRNFLRDTTRTCIDSKTKVLNVDGKTVNLKLVDTAGTERHRAMTRQYYRNSDGVVLVYDVTKLETYYSVNTWLSEIRENTDGVVLLVANKNDCSSHTVNVSAVKQYAENEGLEFMETSAKTGEKVEKIFVTLVRKILKRYEGDTCSVDNTKSSSNSTGTAENAEGLKKIATESDCDTSVNFNNSKSADVLIEHQIESGSNNSRIGGDDSHSTAFTNQRDQSKSISTSTSNNSVIVKDEITVLSPSHELISVIPEDVIYLHAEMNEAEYVRKCC